MIKRSTKNRILKRIAHSRTEEFLDVLRYGYNNYGFIFYIGGISAILGGVFGVAGWLSIIVTILFLYYAGKFKLFAEKEKEKNSKKHKN